MLRIDRLTYRIGDRLLFADASVHVPAGHRVGVVGRNGAGKTTLLRLVLGEQAPDAGEVRLRKGASVGTVAQDAPDGPASLLDTVLAADRERTALLAEAETADDPERIADIHARLNDIGAHAAPARAAAILAGLGFDEAAQKRPLSGFSGGWRMRVALAAALFAEPDLLLLDEPTNHLDLEAALWLESYLKRYSGTILLVSHDRDLLNRVVDRILHVDGGGLTLYTGGYDRFERTRRERLALQEKARAKLAARRRHMQAFVDRFRYKATKARQAQSRLKALARLRDLPPPPAEDEVAFRFPEPEPLAPPLIALDGVAVGYGDGKPVLADLDLRIDMDDRIALLGANGNGKSTLAKLLSDRLAPMAGRRRRSGKLRVGYFAQHQMDELVPGDSAYAHMARLMANAGEAKVRARLGQFGFAQAKADTAVASLSGGEKARLLFALMSHAAPHLMILDEPTNHLDVAAREALVEALNAYAGAVILISHDRHIIELTADRLWLVADGRVRPFEGDVDDYRAAVLSGRGSRASGEPAKRAARRRGAEARAALAPLREAARRAARLVEELSAERAALEAKLADPATYEGGGVDLAGPMKRQAEIGRRLAAAEAAWLEAEERLEAARSE